MKVFDLLNVPAMLAGRGRAMAAGNFTPSFELTMARKDLRLMLETAGESPLAALPCVAKRMDDLIAQGHGADDLAVLGIR
jgi:3-hydroxyisobutyrate dehydrogenase